METFPNSKPASSVRNRCFPDKETNHCFPGKGTYWRWTNSCREPSRSVSPGYRAMCRTVNRWGCLGSVCSDSRLKAACYCLVLVDSGNWNLGRSTVPAELWSRQAVSQTSTGASRFLPVVLRYLESEFFPLFQHYRRRAEPHPKVRSARPSTSRPTGARRRKLLFLKTSEFLRR